MIADGLHPALPLAEYLALPHYGSSSLKAMRLGPPALVPWQKANPHPETDATVLGTAAHCAILQRDLYGALYAVKPHDAPDRPTEAMRNAAKPSPSSVERVRWWSAFELENAGKSVVSMAFQTQVDQIVDAFREKDIAQDSLAGAAGVEESCLWTCPTSGLHLKGRPDWRGGEYVYDLKVSRHALVGRSLAFRAFTEGWMHQLSHNRDGLIACGVPVKYGRLVVIAPKPPQALRVWCVEVKEAALDILALENEGIKREMAKCEASGEWPGTPDEWTKVEPPQSALAEVVALADIEEID